MGMIATTCAQALLWGMASVNACCATLVTQGSSTTVIG